MGFWKGEFVKSSLLHFLDNREREMEGTTTRKRDMGSSTGLLGDQNM